jgi:hypothetical protein
LKVHLSRRTFTINDDFHLRLNERVYSSKQSVGAMHTTHPDLKREKTNPVGGIPAINHKTDITKSKLNTKLEIYVTGAKKRTYYGHTSTTIDATRMQRTYYPAGRSTVQAPGLGHRDHTTRAPRGTEEVGSRRGVIAHTAVHCTTTRYTRQYTYSYIHAVV